jgi:maleylacetate reductase
VRFNASATPEAMARIADALGVPDAATGIFDFAAAIGAPTSLATLGMDPNRLGEAAELTAQVVTWNPRPVSAADVRRLLHVAFAGARP